MITRSSSAKFRWPWGAPRGRTTGPGAAVASFRWDPRSRSTHADTRRGRYKARSDSLRLPSTSGRSSHAVCRETDHTRGKTSSLCAAPPDGTRSHCIASGTSTSESHPRKRGGRSRRDRRGCSRAPAAAVAEHSSPARRGPSCGCSPRGCCSAWPHNARPHTRMERRSSARCSPCCSGARRSGGRPSPGSGGTGRARSCSPHRQRPDR